jgi:hypothetical protein
MTAARNARVVTGTIESYVPRRAAAHLAADRHLGLKATFAGKPALGQEGRPLKELRPVQIRQRNAAVRKAGE